MSDGNGGGEERVRIVLRTQNGDTPVTDRDLLALAIGQVAAAEAGELMRLGGYPEPSAEEATSISRDIARGARAMALLIEDLAATTDEQLEGAAQELGACVLRERRGPPPMAH